jgi:hypothetical protein
MNTLQRQINLTSFRFRSSACPPHMPATPLAMPVRNHRQTVAVRHFGIGASLSIKRQRLQGISGKNGIRFAKFDVAGRQTATQIVIVHRRQIIVHQRVGMDALNGGGRGVQRG